MSTPSSVDLTSEEGFGDSSYSNEKGETFSSDS